MFTDLWYFTFVQITLLVPGYTLIRKTKYFRKHAGIELCLAYCVTLVIFALFATLDYAFKFPAGVSRILCWLIIIYGFIEFFRLHYYRDLLKLRFPLLALFAMTIFASAFINLTFAQKYAIVPDPTPQSNSNYTTLNVKVLNLARTPANDNYIPYRQAQFFVNRSDPKHDSFIGEWGVNFFERTPLMGAVTANYFNLLGDKPPINFIWAPGSADPDRTYQKFQILAQILNYLFVVPAFFLLVKLFDRKTAIITSLFLVPSSFFLLNAYFTWPKSLVAFFILTSWLLLLEKKPSYTLTAGIISGVAYLTHDLAILYIGASFVLLLVSKRFRELLFFTIPVIVLALPWYIASNLIYKQPSSFYLYPLSTGGIPPIEQKHQIVHNFFHTSPLGLIKIRISNWVYLLSPYQLLTSEGGQNVANRMIGLGQFSIAGALGLGLIIPAVLGAVKNWRRWILWILILLPVFFESLVIGWPKGLGAMHFAEAVVVLLSALGVTYLLGLKQKLWLLMAYLINAAGTVFYLIYTHPFSFHHWLHSASDLASLIVIAVILAGCGWLIYQTARAERTWLTG